jgi:signal transduction histidine kinase
MALDQEELLRYILRVSRRMAELRTLEPLLWYVVDEALQLVGGERGCIVLLRPDETFEFKTMRDKEGRDLTDGNDQISHSIVDKVITNGQSLVVRNAMTDADFSQAKSVRALQLRSIMCVPLIARDRTIGALYVENRSVAGRFGEGDLAPLVVFANQAAVAIENAALNDALKAAHLELQEVDEMKSSFILLVSHELRTPLAVVQTYTGLLKGNATQPSRSTANIWQQGYLGKLQQAVERMGKTIEEVIHVFRITSGQLQLWPGPIRLDDIIRPVMADLAPICAERGLQLRTVGLHELPALYLDGKQMRLALRNVLDNAVKYTPDGGTIELEASLKGSDLTITVRDSGVGIPSQAQELIFDIFCALGEMRHHANDDGTFPGIGFGLGLPIARGIVEAHGGTISLESPGYHPEQPPGTTCTISLPLRKLEELVQIRE